MPLEQISSISQCPSFPMNHPTCHSVKRLTMLPLISTMTVGQIAKFGCISL